MEILQWHNNVDLGDLLTFTGLFLAALSVVFTGRQLRTTGQQVQHAGKELEETMRSQRAQHLLAIHNLYFGHELTRRFYYKLDWQLWHFDPERIANSEEEPWLDNLLYNLDAIGRMVRIGAVPLEDAKVIAFQAARVMKNAEVQKYLTWLTQEYRNQRFPPPHEDAQYLADRFAQERRFETASA